MHEYPLPITNYQLPITHYQLPITNYPLPITNYGLYLPVEHSLLRLHGFFTRRANSGAVV
ncbi:MAG TPA: alpha/beta hydrolase [Cyanobacteria bacterium UBA11372]|nr:alpha/beta hydrolase [Cyanobacteria bacterium UBA11372]